MKWIKLGCSLLTPLYNPFTPEILRKTDIKKTILNDHISKIRTNSEPKVCLIFYKTELPTALRKADHTLSELLKTVLHKFYLVHS